MKIMPCLIAGLWWLVVLTGFCAAQPPAVPRVTHQPVGAAAVVTGTLPSRVVEEVVPVAPSAVVAARPVVGEAVVAPAQTASWWNAFGRMSYGFYDDGFTDDNWFYDYYEVPTATVAIQQPAATAPGTRTGWRYDPQVEQRLFRW